MARIFDCDIVLLLILLGCCGICDGTLIQLNPYTKESYSNCQLGFFNGLDRYIYNGSINTTSQNLSTRQVVIFKMKASSTADYDPVCQLIIYPYCDSNQPLNDCYCRNKPDSMVELILNLTANIKYSNGTVRMHWPHFGYQDDISNEEQVPFIYDDPIESLTVNNNDVKLDTCVFHLETQHFIQWCVKGLSSHFLTLNISSTSRQVQNECVNHTYTSSNTESTPIYLNLSYVEQDGCKRSKSTFCYLDYVSTSTIASTPKTTLDVSTSTIASISNANTSVTTTPIRTILNGLIGLLSTHVICTVTLTVIFIILVANILVTGQSQGQLNGKQKHLNLLCILAALFEIAQIILVIIAGVKFSGEGDTALDIWKIMIIYQALLNILFIVVELIILLVYASNSGFQNGSQAFLYLITLISIQTVIGIIAVPFFWHSIGNNWHISSNATDVGLQSKEISSSLDRKSENRFNHNEEKTIIHPDDNSKNEVAHSSEQENAEEVSDQSKQRKGKKTSKKSRRDRIEKQASINEKENTGINHMRLDKALEIKIKHNEKNSFSKSKDKSLQKQKRPTSIEVINNPDLSNIRTLPPINEK